jgi:hypothetical protein
MPAQNASKAIPTAKASELNAPPSFEGAHRTGGLPPIQAGAVMVSVEKSEMFAQSSVKPLDGVRRVARDRVGGTQPASGPLRNRLIPNIFFSTLSATKKRRAPIE